MISIASVHGRRRGSSPGLASAFYLAVALTITPSAAAASGGEQLWRFYADFSVAVVVPIADLSGNGGMDLLVGSADDTLYLVEGRGTGKGAQLWSSPFRSTLTTVSALDDVTGDGKPDVFGGDELGFMQAINGATGAAAWKYLTFGAVLSSLSIPDANGDDVPDVLVGSENDTLYCLSGKPSTMLGKVIWQFGTPIKRTTGGGGGGRPKLAATAPPPAADAPSGVNSLTLLRQGNAAFGVVAGASNDSVYCFPLAGGGAKWKVGIAGDAWEVAAFPDMDGDGIEEVLVACGADIAYLLKGSNGAVLWTRAVSMGALSAAASADMTGDGKADALIGDGGGKVHCVSGKAQGTAAAAWTYDFRDLSTIHSIAPLGDVDGDGLGDCAVGTSSDLVAVITGKGAQSWSVNMGGTVFSVASLGDLDGNGTADVAAGTEMGFAAAYQGFGNTSNRLNPGLHRDGAALDPWARRIRLTSGSGVTLGIRDMQGRRLPAAARAGSGR